MTDTLQAYAAIGLGFEAPTLNELAYRTPGASGLNSQLQTGLSRSSELDLRARRADWSWSESSFDTCTDNEIAVVSNTEGQSNFLNAGHSLRQGLQASADGRCF